MGWVLFFSWFNIGTLSVRLAKILPAHLQCHDLSISSPDRQHTDSWTGVLDFGPVLPIPSKYT